MAKFQVSNTKGSAKDYSKNGLDRVSKWVRFGFVFCVRLALKTSFYIDKEQLKDFSDWVRFAKWWVRW
jgi:hypothetical protein